MAEKQKSTRTIAIGTIIVIVVIGIILASWLQAENSRKKAFEAGYYKHSYEVLEDARDRARVDLVRTALYVSTCDGRNEFHCDEIKRERNQLIDRGFPDKITDSDAKAYEQASLDADVLVMSIENTIEQNDYFIELIHENGIDEDLSELIDTTVQEASAAHASLRLADHELSANPDNEAIRTAREALETSLAQFETKDLPAGWDYDDVEAALEELQDTRQVLNEQTGFD